MRSLKRTFLAGLVLLFLFSLMIGGVKSLYQFPGQLKKLLLKITHYQIPGSEYVAAIIAIFLLGMIAQRLSRRRSSKFSLIYTILGAPKIINKIIYKAEKGEIDVVMIKMAEDVYCIGLTANETKKTDKGEMVYVFRPLTPHFYAGLTVLILKEKMVYLPELKGKVLEILFHGWIG